MTRYLFILTAFSLLLLSCKKEKEDDIQTNKKPTITILSPEENSYFFLNDTIDIHIEASDSDGSISEVRFYYRKELEFTDYEKPFIYPYIAKESGNKTIEIYAVDNNDTLSDHRYCHLLINDIPKPNVYLNDVSWYIETDEEIEIIATLTEVYGEIEYCRLYINDSIYDTDYSEPYEFTWSHSVPGNYGVYVETKTSMGGIGKSAVRDIYVSGNTPPSISMSSPSNNNYPFIPGENIEIEVHAGDINNDSYTVQYYVDYNLIGTSGMEDKFLWEDIDVGYHSINAIAIDEHNAYGYSDTVNIEVLNGIPVDQNIIDLEASNDPNLVFGIYEEANSLLFIQPDLHEISSMNLPYSNANKIKFSKSTNQLIISYKNSGIISIYDQNNDQISSVTISTNQNISDMDIDETNSQIFIAGENKIYVYDLISMSQITVFQNYIGNDLEVNPIQHRVYSISEGYPAILYHYKYESGNLVLHQTLEDIGNEALELSLHNNYSALLAQANNNPYPKSYDATDLNNYYGEYEYNDFINTAQYSTNGLYTFFVSAGNELAIHDSYYFNQIGTQYLPNSQSCTSIVSYDNEQKIIVFTYSRYNSKAKVLYIFSVDDLNK